MSTTERKVVLRFKLPQLAGNFQAALAYFTERLGPPEEVDTEDEWLFYKKPKNKDLAPPFTQFLDHADIVRPFIVPCSVRNQMGYMEYGFEVWLAHMDETHYKASGLLPEIMEGKGINFAHIDLIRRALIKIGFPDHIQPSIHAYSWYNGTDEPIRFD